MTIVAIVYIKVFAIDSGNIIRTTPNATYNNAVKIFSTLNALILSIENLHFSLNTLSKQ